MICVISKPRIWAWVTDDLLSQLSSCSITKESSLFYPMPQPEIVRAIFSTLIIPVPALWNVSGDKGCVAISPLPMPTHSRHVVVAALPYSHLQGRFSCTPCIRAPRLAV